MTNTTMLSPLHWFSRCFYPKQLTSEEPRGVKRSYCTEWVVKAFTSEGFEYHLWENNWAAKSSKIQKQKSISKSQLINMLMYSLVMHTICSPCAEMIYAVNCLPDLQTTSWNEEVCWCECTAAESRLRPQVMILSERSTVFPRRRIVSAWLTWNLFWGSTEKYPIVLVTWYYLLPKKKPAS